MDCIHDPIDISGMGKEVETMSKGDLVGKQLYINPDECIDCGACLPECPVEAIYESEQKTIDIEGDDTSVKKNYDFFGKSWKSR